MNVRQSAPADASTQIDDMLDAVILCADEGARGALAHWFASLPVHATVADDGYHASRLLQDRAYRLLITDRLLPPWPGLETFRALRERNPNLRIAFVESGSLDDRILARITGVTDFLPRPLKRDALIDMLTQKVPAP